MDKNIVTKVRIKEFSVVLFVLLLSTAHTAATTVSIANVTAEPGDTVTLPIMINDITDYGSGTIRIWYDHLVVHVNNITGSPNSTIAATYTNNSIGYTAISASNPYGASGDIAFANVEFTVVGVGSSPLNLVVASLHDNAPTSIPRSISNGSITVPQPPKSFSIDGHVSYKNGTPGNNSTVNIINLNTYEGWQAETGGGSNYYQISLTSGIDLNASEILRFNITDGVYSSVADHIVTADEVDGYGLFDFNLTLGPMPGDVNGDRYLTTADATIVLQMAVRGEYSEVADVSGDDIVASLDALMILQAVDHEGR